MTTNEFQAEKATDDSTDDETTDCGCTEELACFEHYEPNTECDGDREAVTALADGGETDDVHLGDTFHLEGVTPVCEVAMIDDGAVVLETVDGDQIRQYIIPKAAIENGHIAVPA